MAPSFSNLTATIKPLIKSAKWPSSSEQLSQSCVTPGGKTAWKEIPHADTELIKQLKHMYWRGVRRELIYVIAALKEWETLYVDLELPDEGDRTIYGFDTFLDQVNESSRDFALQYGR
jgi:hypothetical protein